MFEPSHKFAIEYKLVSVKVLQKKFLINYILGSPIFFFNPSSVPLSSSSKTTGMHTLKKKKVI